MPAGILGHTTFDEHELAWIGAGMAAGHLTQARDGTTPKGKRPRDERKPVAVLRLEHMHAACEWLMFAGRYKLLSLEQV